MFALVLFLLLLLLSHINSCQTSRVRGHTKGAGALGRSEKPSEIKIRQGNTTLSRLKTHDTEKGAQVKMSNVPTELTWPRVSTQLQHRFLCSHNYLGSNFYKNVSRT